MSGRLGSGVILLDKPAGPTSFAVADRVRRALVTAVPELAPTRRRRRGGGKGPRFKCGHAGSLDPLATGLLVVMVGRGTRLSPFLMGLDKTYRTVVRFGVGTDTHDAAGEVTTRREVAFDSADIEGTLAAFRGEIQQRPPAFSAIKRDGKRMYALARAGGEVPRLEARAVRIDRLEVTPVAWGGAPADLLDPVAADGLVYEAELLIDCSSGTYVRSLARDLAAALGTAGHVRSLRRERVGPFHVDEALVEFEAQDGEALLAAMRPLAGAVSHLPTVHIDADEAALIRTGGQPLPEWLDRLEDAADRVDASLFSMLTVAGDLVAVGRTDEAGVPHSAAVFPAQEEAE